MAVITPTTAALDIDQMWTPELNRAIHFDLVLMNLLDDRSSQLPHGNILYMPTSHTQTAQTKTPGTDVTPEAITETRQTFTVATYQVVAQQLEDISAIQSKYDLRAEITYAGSYALSRAQDVNAAVAIAVQSTQSVGTLGSELTLDNLIRARQYLKDSAAPGPFLGAVSPATYGGFLKLDALTNTDYTGDSTGSALADAHIGRILNTTYYESQLLSGTAPNSTGQVWSKAHFFKIIQQAPMTHTWYSPFALAWAVSMSQIYDAFTRNEADEAAVATTASNLWSVRLQAAK
ncbi:MAG: phage capsid protein [Pseudomonas sp.]